MAKVDTVTVYHGTDPYIINAAEIKNYLAKGFTKKATKATDNTKTGDATASTDKADTSNTTGAATTSTAASTATTDSK